MQEICQCNGRVKLRSRALRHSASQSPDLIHVQRPSQLICHGRCQLLPEMPIFSSCSTAVPYWSPRALTVSDSYSNSAHPLPRPLLESALQGFSAHWCNARVNIHTRSLTCSGFCILLRILKYFSLILLDFIFLLQNIII